MRCRCTWPARKNHGRASLRLPKGAPRARLEPCAHLPDDWVRTLYQCLLACKRPTQKLCMRPPFSHALTPQHHKCCARRIKESARKFVVALLRKIWVGGAFQMAEPINQEGLLRAAGRIFLRGFRAAQAIGWCEAIAAPFSAPGSGCSPHPRPSPTLSCMLSLSSLLHF